MVELELVQETETMKLWIIILYAENIPPLPCFGLTSFSFKNKFKLYNSVLCLYLEFITEEHCSFLNCLLNENNTCTTIMQLTD